MFLSIEKKGFVLLLTVLFIMVQLFSFASANATDVISIMDFENNSSQGWSFTHPDKSAVEADASDENNTVLRLSSASSTGKISSYASYDFSEAISGKLLIDFNYKNTNTKTQYEKTVRFINSNEPFNKDKYLFQIGTGTDALGTIYINSNISTMVSKPTVLANASQWYHFTLIVDTLNSNIEKVYVNGDLVAENFAIASGTNPFNIKHIALHNRCSGGTTGAGNLFIDNLRIRTISENIPPVSKNLQKTVKAYANAPVSVDLSSQYFDVEGSSITLTSDKGTMNNETKTLTYTPTTAGVETIHVTADDGTDTATYEIKLNVVPTHLITINKTGNGTINYTGENIVEAGKTLTITVTPDSGYELEYIKYNSNVVECYKTGEVSYKTPAVNADAVVEVSFSPAVTEPKTNTSSSFYREVEYEGEPSVISFATARDRISSYSLSEYGMVFSKTDSNPEIGKNNCIKAQGTVERNMLGQFGIRFTGAGIIPGNNYYVRAYAIYSDKDQRVIVYGDAVTLTLE